MLFALLSVLLLVLSLTVRYLVVVGAGQPRPRQFYVREANVVVDAEDRLFTAEDQGGPRLIDVQLGKGVSA